MLCSWILAGSLSQLHVEPCLFSHVQSVHLSDLPSLNDATVFDVSILHLSSVAHYSLSRHAFPFPLPIDPNVPLRRQLSIAYMRLRDLIAR